MTHIPTHGLSTARAAGRCGETLSWRSCAVHYLDRARLRLVGGRSDLAGLLQVDHDLAERVTGLHRSQCLRRFVEGIGLEHLGV